MTATQNHTGCPGPTPKLSVLMSVYNGEPYLREAVESVLNQTFGDFEFIIVDDCSEDASAEILESYDDPRIVRLYNPTNLGLTRSLNRGLEHAGGKSSLARMRTTYHCRQGLAISCSIWSSILTSGFWVPRWTVINEWGDIIGKYELPVSHAMIAWQLFFGRSLAHPTVMMRRSVMEKAGGYDVSLPHIEDFELWTRLVEMTRIANLSSASYKYRRRPDSISSTKADEQLNHVISVRRLFAKRLLESEPPRHLLEWLHYSQLPENQLTSEQRIKVISFILSLKQAMQEKGIIRADEAGEVHADMLTRVSLATGRPPPAPSPAPSRYDACITAFSPGCQGGGQPEANQAGDPATDR